MAIVENPILLDLPEQFESERLILRPPRLGDGAAIHAAIEASRDQLRPFMAFADQTRDETEKYIRRSMASWIKRDVAIPLTIWRKGDGAFIGGTGFHDIDWQIPSLEIGYWISTQHSGHGYMTEAVLAQVEFARKYFGAMRLEIWCFAHNTRSAAVAQRAGFTQCATMVNSHRTREGKLVDYLGFARTWNAEPPAPSVSQADHFDMVSSGR